MKIVEHEKFKDRTLIKRMILQLHKGLAQRETPQNINEGKTFVNSKRI